MEKYINVNTVNFNENILMDFIVSNEPNNITENGLDCILVKKVNKYIRDIRFKASLCPMENSSLLNEILKGEGEKISWVINKLRFKDNVTYLEKETLIYQFLKGIVKFALDNSIEIFYLEMSMLEIEKLENKGIEIEIVNNEGNHISDVVIGKIDVSLDLFDKLEDSFKYDMIQIICSEVKETLKCISAINEDDGTEITGYSPMNNEYDLNFKISLCTKYPNIHIEIIPLENSIIDTIKHSSNYSSVNRKLSFKSLLIDFKLTDNLEDVYSIEKSISDTFMGMRSNIRDHINTIMKC